VSAVLSPCGRYRYRLDRSVDLLGRGTVGFCLHNPSTADADVDDPTTIRCIGFARAFGAARLVIVNPWAGRATRPRDLWAMADPVGPDNARYVAEAAAEIAVSCGFMVAGWGAVTPPARLQDEVGDRLAFVAMILRASACPVLALGVTRNGSPRHPLYVSRDTRPVLWPARRPESMQGIAA